MKLYSIAPRDAVCFRGGAGAIVNVMKTLPFPWPSSVAGLMRTRAGSDASGRFVHSDPDSLKQLGSLGPLLLADNDIFVPAPRDVLYASDASTVSGSGAATLGALQRRLRPIEKRDWPVPGAQTDLAKELAPVGIEGDAVLRKPQPGPPFWSWSELQSWLVQPRDHVARSGAWMRGDGRSTLPRLAVEERVHVSLNDDTGTAAFGALFSTEGLRFAAHGEDGYRQLELLAGCDAQQLTPGVVCLGGKGRPSLLREASVRLPAAPSALLATSHRTFRVVLLTPALFRQGSMPEQDAGSPLGGARIRAALVPRFEAISGWDLARRRPKPTRRAVPAGSVFWVELPSGVSAREWIQRVWMQPISDEVQDRRDGFGVAVVGVE